jgi:hypothetical protein
MHEASDASVVKPENQIGVYNGLGRQGFSRSFLRPSLGQSEGVCGVTLEDFFISDCPFQFPEGQSFVTPDVQTDEANTVVGMSPFGQVLPADRNKVVEYA